MNFKARAQSARVPVAQLEERSPPEAEAARSNRAGYTSELKAKVRT